MNLQYIHNENGTPVFVVLPIEEYRRLTGESDEQWADIPYQSDEFDHVAIPSEVVDIMIDQNVGALAAWRIYRGMTQTEAAAKAGISQSALSQIEKSGRPQAKTREMFARIYQCEPGQLAI